MKVTLKQGLRARGVASGMSRLAHKQGAYSSEKLNRAGAGSVPQSVSFL